MWQDKHTTRAAEVRKAGDAQVGGRGRLGVEGWESSPQFWEGLYGFWGMKDEILQLKTMSRTCQSLSMCL